MSTRRVEICSRFRGVGISLTAGLKIDRCRRHIGFFGIRSSIHDPPTFSPRDRISVLLLEGIGQTAVDYFSSSGYTNLVHLPKALDDKDLKARIADAHIIGIRSRTQLTDEIFESAKKLIAFGCFSVGTDQVDLDAARRRGIPVFNASYSNTRSVAELVIGEIIMLTRQIFQRSASADQDGWEKSAVGSREVLRKTLGIVGYGNIGSQLSALAKAWAWSCATSIFPFGCAAAIRSRWLRSASFSKSLTM